MKRARFPLAIACIVLAGLSAKVDAQQDAFGLAPKRRFSELLARAEQAWRNFTYHFWDPDNAIPRLRPTSGDGRIRNDARFPVFWQMEEANDVLYWRWKMTGSEPVREMIRSQFREIRSRYSDKQLSSAAWSGYHEGGINQCRG